MDNTNTQNPNNPNQYNPQTGNLVLNNSTTGIGQTPPVIPAGVGLGSIPTPSLPNTQTGAGASGLSGAAAGYMAMPALTGTQNFGSQLASANNVANQNAQQGQQDYQSQVLGLINQMQNRPGELEQQYGIQQLSADALKAKANYDSVELAYRRQKEATMTDPRQTAEAKQAQIGEIERKEASQKADIAIDYNLKAGLLSNAKELMQKQIALELEPMKLKVDYYKDNRDRFDKILDKTEMRQYDFIQKKEERAYQAAQKAADRIASFREKAIAAGIPWDKAKEIRSENDYYSLVGQEKGLSENAVDIIKTAELINTAATERTRGFRRGVGRRGLLGLRGARETPVAGTKVADFRSDLDRLKGLLAKDGLATLKGTISDKDIAFLERLGTSLNYTMTEDKFNEALIQLDDTFKRNYGVGFRPINEQDPEGLGIDVIQYDPAGLGI